MRAPNKLYLEQWPEESGHDNSVHYVETGYGDDMRGDTSRITVYVRETAYEAMRKKYEAIRRAYGELLGGAKS